MAAVSGHLMEAAVRMTAVRGIANEEAARMTAVLDRPFGPNTRLAAAAAVGRLIEAAEQQQAALTASARAPPLYQRLA